MNSTDWYNCGAKIGELVQNAIDRNDFKQLNDAITDTSNATVDAVQSSININRDAVNKGKGQGSTYRVKGNAYNEAKARADLSDMFETTRRSAFGEKTRSPGRSMKGVFSMVAGYGMAILSGIAALLMLFLSWLTGFGIFGISVWIFAILAAIFAIVGAKGGGYRSRMRQLERYMQIMDGRDVVTIKELADGTGRSVKQVTNDLKNMIRDGMFVSEAYLDSGNTTLMTSRKAYQQYTQTMKAYEERKAQEKASSSQKPMTRSQAEKDLQGYSEETRQILSDGREFIRHIHECNDKIPDPAMTAKLDTLEKVVTRIFEQVAREPDSAPDMHRMMSYYLPTTRKLLDAYVELGSAPGSGDNITRTRNEIEKSLDTINQAFENFLDSFYQDTAWDISSDISAMKTMMARDGLTGGDFSRVRKVGQDVGGNEHSEAGSEASEMSAAETTFSEGAAAAASYSGGAAAAASFSGGAAAAAQEEEREV